MDTLPQPFMTSVFTASSHHPFNIPKQYQNSITQGQHPIHKTISYSDNALRQFFNHAKHSQWFHNTLFVITADHTNILTHLNYQNDKGIYEIPIIFYDPQWTDSQDMKPLLGTNSLKNTTPTTQCDILPSILNFIRYPYPYFAFGENILTKTKQTPFVTIYNEPLYQCLSDHLLIQFDGQNLTSVFDYNSDPCLSKNLQPALKEDKEVKSMLQFMKAYIQQYMERMTENKLSVFYETH